MSTATGTVCGIEQRIRLFLDVLAAVAHAHSNLVVHRDLKPSNILVTGQGEVKLLDFGIAALLSRGGDDVTPLTGHIGPGLTPGYAAPEQLLGQPITTATDVYALGTVLFELLAGRRPASARGEAENHRGVDPVDAGDGCAASVGRRFRARIGGGACGAISTTSLRWRCAGILDERYRTAEAVRAGPAALPRARARVGAAALVWLSARRSSCRGIAWRWSSACAVAIALIAAGAFSVWQMIQANEQRRLAEDQASRAEFARDFAEFVLTDAGTTGRPFTTVGAAAACGASHLGAIRLGRQPGGDRAGHQARHAVRARLGQYRKALQLFEQAHARALAGNYAELRWQSACELGRLHHYAGRVRQSADLLDAAIAELQRQLAGFAGADRMPRAEIGSRVDAAGYGGGHCHSAGVRRAGAAVVSAGAAPSGLATRSARNGAARSRPLPGRGRSATAVRSSCSKSSAGNARPMQCSSTTAGAS